MSRFKIYSADGGTVRYEGKPRYNGVFGGVSYLEFSQIASPTPIDFHVGDYVDYARTGFRYKLYSIPFPTKKSGNNTVGDTYIYKNVQFHCATKDLELAPFRDLVLNDNLIHFTTLPTISVYDDVWGIAQRIQACIDDYIGTPGVWGIAIMSNPSPAVAAKLAEEKEFSVSNVSCLEALNEIYNLWGGIGWVYSVVNGRHTITLGRPNVQNAGNTTDMFSYGKGNGLTVIAQAESSKSELATRIYPYGSDRNLLPRYYNSRHIYSAESVYLPNLMIPDILWGTTNGYADARKAYVQDDGAIAEYGLIPKTIYFDGTGEYEEIYPSLEGVTFAELRSAMFPTDDYYPSSIYPDSHYINTIKSAVNPTDNGVIENAGNRYLESDTVPFSAITESFAYSGGQEVLTINPGQELVSYTAIHTGKMKIDLPALFTVEAADMMDATANIIVMVNGSPRKTVPISVNRTRMDVNFETGSVSLDVNAQDEVSVVVDVEVHLYEGNTGGSCYVTGTAGTATVTIQYTIGDSFTLVLKQIGFDISKQGSPLSNGLATISMKSGWCGGRNFVIKSCTYEPLTDEWVCQCYRQKDDTLGQYFPNSIAPITAGDSYVLVDLMMPDIYIRSAEMHLYNRAMQVLQSMSKPRIVYSPEIDAKVLAESPELLIEGMYMPVYDENLIPTTVQASPHTAWVLISSITISEDESAIPLYKVTLSDEKPETFLQSYTHEMKADSTRLRMEAVEESRGPYIPSEEDEGVASLPYVEIVASAEFFTYPAGASSPVEGDITLQAVPHDIANPTYQWYYYGLSGWTELTGATDQAYVVDPDDTDLYPDGDYVAEFKVIVTAGETTYEAERKVVKITGGEGSDGLTIMLGNYAHVFGAGADGHAYAGTDTVSVLAFRGTTSVPTTVGTITGAATGLSVTKVNNGGTNTYLTVSASTSLADGGVLVIPVTADGKTVDLRYSWSLSPKGEAGDSIVVADLDNEMDGISVKSDGTTPSQYVLSTTARMWYGQTAMTLSQISVGTLPSGVGVSASTSTGVITFIISQGATITNHEITITITGSYGGTSYSRAVVFTIVGVESGEDAVIYSILPSVSAVKKLADGTYSVASVTCEKYKRVGQGGLSTTTDGSLKFLLDGNGEYNYVAAINTTRFTQSLTFRYYINNVLVDQETIPMVYDGEPGDPGGQGERGKAPRGPSDYSASTQYSGIEGTGDFIDYVYNANRTKMYVCIKTPPVGTPLTNTTYWQESTIQNFVATKVFYAQYGYVQNLGANAVKIADANGNIFGGFMPPQTPNEGNGDYVFWAGDSTPGTAPFSIDKDGVLKATAGIFSGFLQMPFEYIGDACSYTAGNYYLGNKCNIYADALNASLYLPCTEDQIGKVVNIWDIPVKTQISVSGFNIRTATSNCLYIASSTNTYGLAPKSYLNTGHGGYVQLVAVPGINADAAWMVTVNSCGSFSVG